MAIIGNYKIGIPGKTAVVSATPRIVFYAADRAYLPGGKYIDGTKTRDVFQDVATDTDRIQAGMLLGKITSGGRYANTIIGQMQADSLDNATSITLTAMQATELVRRQGATGTFKLIGPPTAGGTVGTLTVTYTGVNTTTGVVTCNAITEPYEAGSIVCPTDGSETPVTFVPDGFPIPVTDTYNPSGAAQVEFPNFPVAGIIDPSQFLGWTLMDSSLQTWVKTQLSTALGAKYIFKDAF